MNVYLIDNLSIHPDLRNFEIEYLNEVLKMKNLYYSVKDKVTGHYGVLVMAQNDDDAKRGLKVAVNTKGSTFFEFPSDFDLYRVLFIDDENGESVSDIQYICNLESLKRSVKDEVSNSIR